MKMGKTLLMIQAIIMAWSLPAFSQDLYDSDTINTLEITFAEDNWDYLLDMLVTEGEENRLMGTFYLKEPVHLLKQGEFQLLALNYYVILYEQTYSLIPEYLGLKLEQ